MPTEIASALIAAGGAVISAFIAWFVSRAAANKEIEKLKLTWNREDVVSSDDEFATMAAAVSRYIDSQRVSDRRKALELVSFVRSKECGVLATKLDLLYNALQQEARYEADACLAEVIEEKRKAKRHTESAN